MPDKGTGAHQSGQPKDAVPVTPTQDSLLDDALNQTQEVWGGHPNQDTYLTDEDGDEGAAKKRAAKDEDDLGEDDDDLAKAQDKDAKGEKPPKPPKPKGKTLEEEAEFRREAERWAGELNQENKGLKAQNDSLQQRLEALEKKVEGKGSEGEPPSGKEKDSGPGPMAVAKDRIRDLLVQIDELDEFDPDFYDKKADLMAQLYGAKGSMPSEEDLAKLVAKAVKEAKDAEEAEEAERKRGERAAKKIVSLAKKLGLDMREGIGKDEDGNSLNALDWDLFWDVSVRAPKDKSLDDQVKWIVREVKRMKGQVRSGLSRELEDAGAHHRDTAILERHGPGRMTPGTTTSTPAPDLSLQDAILRTRRIV